MHRNTFILVAILAVFAALIVGVNIGRKTAQPIFTQPSPAPSISISPTPYSPQTITYTDQNCGISIDYPNTIKKDEASGSAIFSNINDPTDGALVTCQKDIPRPPLPATKIEPITISSVSGKLYHDASPKDGTPIDKLIFRHPQNGKDVYIAGSGSVFQKIISSLSIIK